MTGENALYAGQSVRRPGHDRHIDRRVAASEMSDEHAADTTRPAEDHDMHRGSPKCAADEPETTTSLCHAPTTHLERSCLEIHSVRESASG